MRKTRRRVNALKRKIKGEWINVIKTLSLAYLLGEVGIAIVKGAHLLLSAPFTFAVVGVELLLAFDVLNSLVGILSYKKEIASVKNQRIKTKKEKREAA